jgi:ketosteroid isomerase-like protein
MTLTNAAGAVLAAALLATPAAHASDACDPAAIVTSADVRVSDGARYTLETFFNVSDIMATRQTRPNGEVNVMALEGPTIWTSGATQQGGDLERTLTLGHQFHALLLNFDGLVGNARTADVSYRGATRIARVGDWPYGQGEVQLIMNRANTRPDALMMMFPGMGARIEIAFSNWRRVNGTSLPHRLSINDGSRTFDYRFTRIQTAPVSPNWFFNTLAAPEIDAVQVHRVHRRALAAHCLGDAAALAQLTAPESIDIARGEVTTFTQAETQTRFSGVFERLNYTAYNDTAWPIIEVAESGDVAWLAAQVQAVGTERQSGEAFGARWAWLMLFRKIDGAWRSTGVGASAAP